ncbi:hypothetical protein Goshw_014915, partial [Gossypium schwendimanii]|nr:hypothetical protein [Gossypium schwendimanii]
MVLSSLPIRLPDMLKEMEKGQSKAKRSRKEKKPEKRGKGNGATGNYRNGFFGMNHSKAFHRFSHKLKFFPRPPIPVISRGLSLSLTSSLLCLYMEMEESK